MKPVKPLFLKTYGKQRRKLSAWVSPENRKQAFDTTTSTDGDVSVFEPSKPTRMRGKKTCGIRGRAVRTAKRKDMLTETSSDEENIRRPSPPCPQPTQKRKTTRKGQLVSLPGVLKRQKGEQVPRTSESEAGSTSTSKCHKNSVHMKTDSIVHLPSAGRFVTRRRRAVAAKPKLPKATSSILNSSSDFTSGAFGSSRILLPSRRRRRRVPPAFLVSSAEKSVNAAGTASFATNPLQEISLNELADHSLRVCPRKPIFCSTPSAGPFSKLPRLKLLSVNDQFATPPSMSESCKGLLSTSQEDLDSPVQPVSSPSSAPPIGLHSEEKLHSSLREQEPSDGLYMEAKRTNKEAKSHSEDIKTKNLGDLPTLNLFSTDDSESSSHFVSAAGGLEWLIEALKVKCLTEHCTVQLERLDNLSVTQLCSQTTYSSCLGQSNSVHSCQEKEYPLSVDSVQIIDSSQSSEPSFNLHLSVTNNKTSGFLQSVNSFESPEHAAVVTDSQSTNNSPSVNCEHSDKHSSSNESLEQSASVLHSECSHHTDSSVKFIMSTQLPANNPVEAHFTEEEAVAVKDICPTKKYNVQLKKVALSRFMQQREASLASDAAISDANKCENDNNLTHSRAPTQSNDPETEEKAAVLTMMLKEKCLTDKLIVKIKRVTISRLKEFLQLRDRTPKSPTDVLDSASADQTKNHQKSESDTYLSNEDTSAMKVNMKKRGSTTSDDKMSSDKEVVKNSSNVLHKRKKISQAPKEKKRRRTSMDRPGTTRKVCVSGLSVSRWTNKTATKKDSTHAFGSRTAQTYGNKAVDCSINELISTQHKQSRELLRTPVHLSTSMRVSRLNLSSLLADLTPNTHTWSRLKAALSVHRKSTVLLNSRIDLDVSDSHPKTHLSMLCSPGRAELADVSHDLFATPFRTTLPKHLRSHLLSSSSLVLCEDADLSDAEKVYAECGQQRPLPWRECIHPQRMKQCVKIGEGTFGEVFSTTNASGDTVALKIIPIEGSEEVNGEVQKTFGEILHEIIISKELSSLKEKQQNQTQGFIGLSDLHCVQGCYPPDFLMAWDAFDQQKGSENDRPDFFKNDQLFIILEFEFGGIDLESSNGTLPSLGVAKSILHQVTAALAVAEQELCFEHRDLHWGNVLVKTTKQKKGSFLLNGAAHSMETKGVLVRIIDYSLSRLEIDDLTVSCDISKDEELFMGQGDYQFDIYRLMRQENGNNWSKYHPHTNVLWLHYLCSKLVSMKYRGSGGRGAKDIREELTHFYDNILQYSSATDTLQNCPMFQ